MKKLTALLALPLAACVGFNPQLAEQPKDPAKYEQDRQACISYSQDVMMEATTNGSHPLPSMFGAAGAIVEGSVNNPDVHPPQKDIIKQCLIRKGYKVL